MVMTRRPSYSKPCLMQILITCAEFSSNVKLLITCLTILHRFLYKGNVIHLIVGRGDDVTTAAKKKKKKKSNTFAYNCCCEL